MIWLIEGIYILALMCGIIWLTHRILRFIRVTEARKEAEAIWADSFAEDDFQALLETLRQKRDSQANEQTQTSQPNNQSADRA